MNGRRLVDIAPMGHGYFGVAGWGVVFVPAEFLLLIAPYLSAGDARKDPADDELEEAFADLLRAKRPGLEAEVVLHYDRQTEQIFELFAATADAAWSDARCGARSRAIPLEPPPAYRELAEACGVGSAGLHFFVYQGA